MTHAPRRGKGTMRQVPTERRRGAMGRRDYRSSIPIDAVEVVEERYPGGAKKSASYFVGGGRVGTRCWEADGRLGEEHSIRAGVKHGRQYRFHANGQPLEMES